MHPLIDRHRAEIQALADRQGLRDLRVFESMARNDATDASDIDFLVSLPPDRTGLDLGALLMDLQDLLQRPVDVLTEAALHPRIRDRVLSKTVRL